MKKFLILFLILVTNTQFSFSYTTSNPNDPNIRAKCRNGKYSTSIGRGTCSRNGGVLHYLTDSKNAIKPNKEASKKETNQKNKQ